MSFVVELVGGPSDGHQMRCDALHDSFTYGNPKDCYRKRTAPVMRTFQPSLLHPPVSAPVWLYDYQPPQGV